MARELDEARWLISRDLHSVQSVMLTTQQFEVLQYIRRIDPNPVLSSDVTSEFGLSASHTSNVMTALYEKGYLTRSHGKSPSGGFEYEYYFRVRDRDAENP